MLIVAENHKIVICIVINFNALDVIKTFADHIIVLRGYQEVRGEGKGLKGMVELESQRRKIINL